MLQFLARMLGDEVTYRDGVKITKVDKTPSHRDRILGCVTVDIWVPIEEVKTEMVFNSVDSDLSFQRDHPEFDEKLLAAIQAVRENPAFSTKGHSTPYFISEEETE